MQDYINSIYDIKIDMRIFPITKTICERPLKRDRNKAQQDTQFATCFSIN